MTIASRMCIVAVGLALGAGACVKERHTPIDQIPQITNLKEVMDNQATTADPLFKKMGQTAFSDAEFAAFADGAARVEATSKKIKDFSKGAGFDALADQLNMQVHGLGDGGRAKDATKVVASLKEMKATCKACHSQFR